MNRWGSFLFVAFFGATMSFAQESGVDAQQQRLARLFDDSRWEGSLALSAAKSSQFAFGFPSSGMLMTNALIDSLRANGVSRTMALEMLESSFTPCLWNYALQETHTQTQAMAAQLDRKQDPKFQYTSTLKDPIEFQSEGQTTRITCMEYESNVNEKGSGVQLQLSYETWKEGDRESKLGEIDIEGFDYTKAEDFPRQREIMANLAERLGGDAFQALFLCLVPILPK